ncbi:A/G-specific adenine glycosylase, partial [Mammaliicoccus sciuri]
NMNVYRAHTQKSDFDYPYKWIKKEEKDQLSFSTSMSKIFNQLNG